MDAQEFRRYFYLFLRWSWLIALCALLGGGAAYAYSRQEIAMYKATTTLMVLQGSTTNDLASIYYSERVTPTYIQMIRGRPVMEAVIEQIGLDYTPEQLAGMIETGTVAETGLIRISVTDANPSLAAQIANAVADEFIRQNEAIQQQRFADSLGSTERQMIEMAKLIEETTAQITALGTPITDREQAELSRLETTLAGYRNTYAMLTNSYEQMRLTAALSADEVVVFETAQVPVYPLPSRSRQNILLAAAVGAMIAVGVAFAIEYMDDTIKSPQDVRETLGLETLGVVGKISARDPELIVAEHPRSATAEAYRALRTSIRFSGIDAPLRTILVTSPGTTEGKSITTANLGVAMAQSGLNVVIVDADLRRPRQHRMFDLKREGGLTQSLLEGRVDGHLRSTAYVEGLKVIPSGELPPNPAELLGSQRMHDFLADLAQQADIVLIDSPPVLPVTDPTVLAQAVDGVLLVVQAGSTRRAAAQRAVEALRQTGANVIGVVINAVPQKFGGYYHYYYYHYYYHDKYYSPDESEPKRRRSKRGLLGKSRRRRRRERSDVPASRS
jgi:succinoglycan biosynthesis transport protein ExoP